MQSPKISVIIPVYNPGKYFIKCIESIVNQTYRNLEIILIDDGSSDGSEVVCDEYAAKDNRIIVCHLQNGGVSKARNVGLELSTGDYVNFPDSDDYIELDTYEYALKQLEDNNADAICFEYFTTYPEKEVKHKASDGKYGLLDTKESICELLFSKRSFLCTKIMQTYAAKQNRFVENIYRGEDTLFCVQTLQTAKKTLFIERPLYHYVQSEQSACRGKFRDNQLSAIKLIPIMEDFLELNYPDMLDQWHYNFTELLIMLYCDMFFDEKKHKEDQKAVYQTFKVLMSKIKQPIKASSKQKIKRIIFNISPTIFCILHKTIQKH